MQALYEVEKDDGVMSKSRHSPAHYSTVKRFSIDGWKVRYFEPTYGMREIVVTTHKALKELKDLLNDSGYVYTIKEIS